MKADANVHTLRNVETAQRAPSVWASVLGWIAVFAPVASEFSRRFFGQEVLEELSPHSWVIRSRWVDPWALSAYGPLLNIVVVVAPALWLLLKWRGSRKDLRPAEIRIDDEAIHVRFERGLFKRRSYPLADIAHVSTDDNYALTVQFRSGAELVLEPSLWKQRNELKRLLRERRSTAASVPAGRTWNTVPGGAVVSWLLMFFMWAILIDRARPAARALALAGDWVPTAVLAAIALGLGALAKLVMAPMRLEAGSDGVRIDRPWRKRFIPYAAIDAVVEKHWQLRLRLGDGDHVVLTTANRAELARVIEAKLAAFADPRAPDLEAEHLERLARGNQSAEAWKAKLDKVLGDETYRGRALRIADLEALVDGGHADPVQRVAAALALPKDEETRQRIRIAATKCADTDTRAALEAAADNELAEAQLERASDRFRRA